MKINLSTKLSLVILFIFSTLALLVAFGFLAADHNVTNYEMSYSSPSSHFLLGTDELGRSTLSRVLVGLLIALKVGLMAAALSLLIGCLLGTLSGFYGGIIDSIVIWLYTTIDSIPYILLLSSFALILEKGLTNVYLSLGLTSWVSTCRLVRSAFIKHRGLEYVVSAKAIGANSFRQIFIHILPNVLPILMIQFLLIFIASIKSEVILSYLGLGVEIGTPSWGTIIDDSKTELIQGAWWNIVSVSIAMFALILSLSIVLESVKSYFDPKLKV